jgi:CRISPR system Cascade subunit CasC
MRENSKNKFTGNIIEFHIVQSFPVSSLNRDETGSPKTAIVGGIERARVSSQAWKRPVREALSNFDINLGVRTKKVDHLIKELLLVRGLTDSAANKISKDISGKITKESLIFVNEAEIESIVSLLESVDYKFNLVKEKDIAKAVGSTPPTLKAIDIALFGRMVAKINTMNIEGAASFSHAISTHKVSNETDFFSALDDFSAEPFLDKEKEAAHIGYNEFNSSTYYRYISLDLGTFAHNMFGDQEIDFSVIEQAVSAFTKALFIATPLSRKNSYAAYSSWDFAKVFIRKGQNLQLSFDKPITLEQDALSGYSAPTIKRLESDLASRQKILGSLFGKIAEFNIGVDDNYSIDHLVNDLNETLKEIAYAKSQ